MIDILSTTADAQAQALKDLQENLAFGLTAMAKAIDDFRASIAANDVAAQGAMQVRVGQMAEVWSAGASAGVARKTDETPSSSPFEQETK